MSIARKIFHRIRIVQSWTSAADGDSASFGSKRRGIRISLVDWSRQVTQGRQLGLNVLQVNDWIEFPKSKESAFDLVRMNYVIEHVDVDSAFELCGRSVTRFDLAAE